MIFFAPTTSSQREFFTFKLEEQYKNLKAAQLQYSSKALHFIMFDDKEWYQNQLTDFIK